MLDQFWAHRLPQVCAALAATVGVFAFGTTIGWASPGLPSLEETKPFELSAQTKAWIGSIVVLGAAFSCPFAGLFAEKLGRKRTIMLMTFPFIAGWLLIVFANSAVMLQLGRFITGFCGGTYSVTVPMYISEISDRQIRGRLGGCFQMFLCLGILFSYFVGSFMSWFSLSLACSVVPFLLIVLMVFMPETPHFLLSKGRISEASRKLCWLRSAGLSINVDPELRQIQRSVNEATHYGRVKCGDFFTKPILKPTGLCLMLMFFQQFSGINAIIFFAHSIFIDAGKHIDDDVGAISIAVVQVIMSMVAANLVDRAGRRVLLLVSQTLVTIALGIIGLYFYLHCRGREFGEMVGWLPLVGFCIFSVGFAVGMGPLPWVIMGELLPQKVKGLTSAMTAMVSWTLAFLIIHFFEQYQDLVGYTWSWWIFAIISSIGLVLIYFLLPETRGKTLEEIQQGFAN